MVVLYGVNKCTHKKYSLLHSNSLLLLIKAEREGEIILARLGLVVMVVIVVVVADTKEHSI